MNWISRLIGETTTASAIPAAGPGSGFGGRARLKFKKKKPQTTIEKLIGTGSGGKPTAPDNPEPEKKEPKPDPEKKPTLQEPVQVTKSSEKKDEEKPAEPIIPPSAIEVGTDGSDLLDPKSMTRADRAVLDLFMPKPKQTTDAGLPTTPAVSEAAAVAMLGLGLGGTSIPSGPMPEHRVSEDGAAKVLEAMHRFTK